MRYGVSITLLAGALDEAARNPDLIKASAAENEDEARLFAFLRDEVDDCTKEAMELFDSWSSGVQQYVKKNGLEEPLTKQAKLLGLETPLPEGAELAAEIGLYLLPVVGTGLMAKDALRNFHKAFKPGMSWKQRLGHSLLGLMDTGFAAISLFPGAGAVGASAKAGKLGKLLKIFGKPGRAAASKLGKLTDVSARAAGALRSAGASGKGAKGIAARALGYSPAYQAGKIRGGLKAVGRKVPGLKKLPLFKKTKYYNPYQRLGQWQTAMRRGSPKAIADTVGSSARSFFGGSALVDQPAWRRAIGLGLVGQMGAGTLTGMGEGPSYATEELRRRVSPEVARHLKKSRPLLRRGVPPRY